MNQGYFVTWFLFLCTCRRPITPRDLGVIKKTVTHVVRFFLQGAITPFITIGSGGPFCTNQTLAWKGKKPKTSILEVRTPTELKLFGQIFTLLVYIVQ